MGLENKPEVDWTKIKAMFKKNGIDLGVNARILDPVLFYLAIEAGDAALLTVLLHEMNDEDLSFLGLKNKRGETLAYAALSKTFNLTLLRPILERFPKENRFEQLEQVNKKGKSVRALATAMLKFDEYIELCKMLPESHMMTMVLAKVHDVEKVAQIKALLDLLNESQKKEVFLSFNKHGNSILQNTMLAIDPRFKSNVPEQVTELISLVPKSCLREVIMQPNRAGKSTLTLAAEFSQVKVVKVLLAELPREDRAEAIIELHRRGEDFLGASMREPFLGMLAMILGECEENKRAALLQLKDKDGITILARMYKSMSGEQLYKIEMMLPESDRGVLVKAFLASGAGIQEVIEMVDRLPDGVVADVLMEKDTVGKTLFEKIIRSADEGFAFHLLGRCHDGAIQKLMENKEHRSVIVTALSKNNQPGTFQYLYALIAPETRVAILSEMTDVVASMINGLCKAGESAFVMKLIKDSPEDKRIALTRSIRIGDSVPSFEGWRTVIMLLPPSDRLNRVASDIHQVKKEENLRSVFKIFEDDGDRVKLLTHQDEKGETILHSAAIRGDLEYLKSAISQVPVKLWNEVLESVRSSGENKKSLLMNAVKSGDFSTVEFVKNLYVNLSSKEAFNAKDSNGDTLLHVALNNIAKNAPAAEEVFLAVLNAYPEGEKQAYLDKKNKFGASVIDLARRLDLSPELRKHLHKEEIQQPSREQPFFREARVRQKRAVMQHSNERPWKIWVSDARMGSKNQNFDVALNDIKSLGKEAYWFSELQKDNFFGQSALDVISGDKEAFYKLLPALSQKNVEVALLKYAHKVLLDGNDLAVDLSKLKNLLPPSKSDEIIERVLAAALRMALDRHDIARYSAALNAVKPSRRLSILKDSHGEYGASVLNKLPYNPYANIAFGIDKSNYDISFITKTLDALPDKDKLTIIKQKDSQNGNTALHWIATLRSTNFGVAQNFTDNDVEGDHFVGLMKNLLLHVPEHDRRAALMVRGSAGYTPLELLNNQYVEVHNNKHGRYAGQETKTRKGMPKGNYILKKYIEDSEAVAGIAKDWNRYGKHLKNLILHDLQRELKGLKVKDSDLKASLKEAIEKWKEFDPQSGGSLPEFPADIKVSGKALSENMGKMEKYLQMLEILQAVANPRDKIEIFTAQFNESLPALMKGNDPTGVRILKSIATILASVVTLGLYPAIRALHSMATRGSAAFWKTHENVMSKKVEHIRAAYHRQASEKPKR